jgi:hypothetical protein
LSGADKITAYIWGEGESEPRRAYTLPRDEYGIVILAGRLTGFTGWIDFALAAAARPGKRGYSEHKARSSSANAEAQ